MVFIHQGNKFGFFMAVVISFSYVTPSVRAFATLPFQQLQTMPVAAITPMPTTDSSSPSLLQMGFLDDLGNFFNDMSGGSNEENSNRNDGNRNDDGDDDDDDEVMELPTTTILTIPVTSIKQGALRMFLTFYLMGMQNTPEQKSWRTSQPTEEYSIDYYYKDMTGAVGVRLLEHEIQLVRLGQTPSNNYLMQEAVIVQGILDEFDACLTEGGSDIKESDRLIQLVSPDAIEKARDAVSFS